MAAGFTSGLAVVLGGEDRKGSSQKNRLISYCDEFGDQSVERTLEHIFDLPYKTVKPLTRPVDSSLVRAIIKDDFFRFHGNLSSGEESRNGVSNSGNYTVVIEESSVCGKIELVRAPLLVESQAVFTSVRANACAWKGKWMYEVILETCGIQQLGWATLSCPFTDHKGVGDADDSYAYDGKRVQKWNKDAESYGHLWVVGDVIGCCIDLDTDEISFYRNGVSLGVAFDGIRKMVPGLGYYPAISLSQGERCEINFGGWPFRYPIQGFSPIQSPPSNISDATNLINCLSRLFEIQNVEKAERLKRFAPFGELCFPISHAILDELFIVIDRISEGAQYIARGPLLSFMMEIFRSYPPHDYTSLDIVLDVLLLFEKSSKIFEYILDALSSFCKTSPLVLTECPYSGSYPYLALVMHVLRREELMILWWKSSNFSVLFEGFLSRKNPNVDDLESLIPSVWWPGSCEDISYETGMNLTTTALCEAVSKIEEKHRDLCRLVIQFTPPTMPRQQAGSVFRTFLQNLLLKNRGAERDVPPPGISSNSVLVSLFTVLLHFLSEGFAMSSNYSWMMGCNSNVGFLHRGGQQSFPLSLFLKNTLHRIDISRLGGSYCHLAKSHPLDSNQEDEVIKWEEGFMDDEDSKVTHSSWQKPCCCSSYDLDFARVSKSHIRYKSGKGSRSSCSTIQERSSHVASECSGDLNDEIVDKPSTSGQSDSDYRPAQHVRIVVKDINSPSAILTEQELFDAMLLLYLIGLAPNFKEASSYMSHQSQSISLLEETNSQIRERARGDQVKRLKEARNVYREEVMDCVRQCAWYRISLFARWKQRGMYATCIWIVQLLLVLTKMDSVFVYIPEFYLETLVDCFHVLRKSDPPFVSAPIFIKQGLSSFVTLVATHFNDPRISSAELRDLLLQSISVLVQYKDFLVCFESNKSATERMPRALLSAFDNRSWIPVTNIFLRLCKGSGFGSSKHGESSSSSIVFQELLREACIQDEELFSGFLNRLFNTLSWAMTEFSFSIREMQEKYKVMEFQQRKCSVIFDLSCNLARVLEFCTREIPQAFLLGADTNMRRLVELLVFILNHLTSVADPEFFDLTLRRPGQSSEKVNRGMILAPLAGIILNLLDANKNKINNSKNDKDNSVTTAEYNAQNDMLDVFASMDCLDTVLCGFQYLLDYNWAGSFSGDGYISQLKELQQFSSLLISHATESQLVAQIRSDSDLESDSSVCCICYAHKADAKLLPCSHISCFACISRHLLNCRRCFFCNATVVQIEHANSKILKL